MKYTFLQLKNLFSYNKKLKRNVFDFLNHLLKALKAELIQSIFNYK